MQKVVHNVADGFLQAFLEFFEVFLVKEYLVLVEGERAVALLAAFALRNGEVKVVVPLRALDVEEIRTFSRPYRLGIDIFPVALPAIVIFTVLT